MNQVNQFKNNASLIIGAGGIGTLTCRYLSSYMSSNTTAASVRKVQFLGIDADPAANKKTPHVLSVHGMDCMVPGEAEQQAAPPLDHFIALDRQEIQNACSEICAFLIQKKRIGHFWPASARETHESILQWLPDMDLETIQCLEHLCATFRGPGLPNRLMARMGFFLSVKQILKQLNQLIARAPRQSPALPLQICIVTSLFGNTGSSLLMDLPSLLSLINCGREFIVKVFLIAGNEYSPSALSHHHRLNAYLTLVELGQVYGNVTGNPCHLSFSKSNLNLNRRNVNPGRIDELFVIPMVAPGKDKNGQSNGYDDTAHQAAQVLYCTLSANQVPEFPGRPCQHNGLTLGCVTGLILSGPLKRRFDFDALTQGFPKFRCESKQAPETSAPDITPQEPHGTGPDAERGKSIIDKVVKACKDEFIDALPEFIGNFTLVSNLERFLIQCKKAAEELSIPLIPDGVCRLQPPPDGLLKDILNTSSDPLSIEPVLIFPRDVFEKTGLPVLEKCNAFDDEQKRADIEACLRSVRGVNPLQVQNPSYTRAVRFFFERITDKAVRQKLSHNNSFESTFKKYVFPHLTILSQFICSLKENIKNELKRSDEIENWMVNGLREIWEEQYQSSPPPSETAPGSVDAREQINGKSSGTRWSIRPRFPPPEFADLVFSVKAQFQEADIIQKLQRAIENPPLIRQEKHEEFINCLKRETDNFMAYLNNTGPCGDPGFKAALFHLFQCLPRCLKTDQDLTDRDLNILSKRIWHTLVTYSAELYNAGGNARAKHLDPDVIVQHFKIMAWHPFIYPGKQIRKRAYLLSDQDNDYIQKVKDALPPEAPSPDPGHPEGCCVLLYEEQNWQIEDLKIYSQLKSAFALQEIANKNVFDLYLTICPKRHVFDITGQNTLTDTQEPHQSNFR